MFRTLYALHTAVIGCSERRCRGWFCSQNVGPTEDTAHQKMGNRDPVMIALYKLDLRRVRALALQY